MNTHLLLDLLGLAVHGELLEVLLPLLDDLVAGQDPLVVPLLRGVVRLHDLGAQLGVLDLLLLRVDRLAALVEHLQHADELGADLLGGHVLQVGTLGRGVGLEENDSVVNLVLSV